MWQTGSPVVLRGMFQEKVWTAQSVYVLRDSPSEVVLVQLPGAQCIMPEGYWFWKSGDLSKGTRWDEMLSLNWKLQMYNWHTNRFLMILEPDAYFATYYIWDHATNVFQCYYINFQLPFKRTPLGFDTLDLALDIVVNPNYSWYLKDEMSYQEGVHRGGIEKPWVEEIESAKTDIFKRINRRLYPLDGSWFSWNAGPSWIPPSLPDGWDTL